MIGLPQAVGTIMVMDIVFSIDSVITAVGMADHLIIMIIAVMLAVFMMMIFIDPISNFINGHPEMKMLALTFIVAIGALLVIDAAGFHTGIEMLHMPLEKIMVYFAMVFCIVLELIQMRYNYALKAWMAQRWREDSDAQLDRVKAEMEERLEEAKAAAGKAVPVVAAEAPAKMHPIIIGQNVYVMMPLGSEDAASFKQLMATDPAARERVGEPLEIPAELVESADAPEEPVYEEPLPRGQARLASAGAGRGAVPVRPPVSRPALDVPSGDSASSRAPLDHSSHASAGRYRSRSKRPGFVLAHQPTPLPSRTRCPSPDF